MQSFTHISLSPKSGEDTTDFIDLIPFGRDSAISRKNLLGRCISKGFIDCDLKDKDRALRILLQRARADYVILNLCDGNGFYRPKKEEANDLRAYIHMMEAQAKSLFCDIKKARALYADYIAGREGFDNGGDKMD